MSDSELTETSMNSVRELAEALRDRVERGDFLAVDDDAVVPESNEIIVDEYSIDSLNDLADIIKGKIPRPEVEDSSKDPKYHLDNHARRWRYFAHGNCWSTEPYKMVRVTALPSYRQLLSLFILKIINNSDSIPEKLRGVDIKISANVDPDNIVPVSILPFTTDLVDTEVDGKIVPRPVFTDSFSEAYLFVTFTDGSKGCYFFDDLNYQIVSVHSDTDCAATTFIDDLNYWLNSDHPYRNKIIGFEGRYSNLISPHYMNRDDLHLSDESWNIVDVNVHGLFKNYQKLFELGLRSNRGLLVYGPPGCGKTAIGRVLLTELKGQVTIITADTHAIKHCLDGVYDLASAVSPSLIILEDIDLVAGKRDDDFHAEALQNLLTILDGVGTNSSGIVTIASTNDPEGIDPAARRSSRFDAEIFISTPNKDVRLKILKTTLEKIGLDLNLKKRSPLIRRTKNFSGSDMIEIVLSTFLAKGTDLTESDLLKAANDYRSKATSISQSFKYKK